MKTEIVDIAEKIMIKNFKNISEPAGGIGYRIDHARRVREYLEKFFALNDPVLTGIDKEVVLAAGILHDIGDLARVNDLIIDYSLDVDHAKEGSKIARKELLKYDIKESTISTICDMILNHHNYDDSRNTETKLVQDADLLEEVGVVNLWQIFTYSANKNRNFEDTLKYWQEEGKNRKLKCIKQSNFNFTKKYALKRYQKLNKTIDNIITEIHGDDF